MDFGTLAPLIALLKSVADEISKLVFTFASSVYPTQPAFVVLGVIVILFMARKQIGFLAFAGISSFLVYALITNAGVVI